MAAARLLLCFIVLLALNVRAQQPPRDEVSQSQPILSTDSTKDHAVWSAPDDSTGLARDVPGNVTSNGPAVLALTTMNGWEHEAIVNATELFKRHAEYRGWNLTISSDPDEHFHSTESLRAFDVIVFLLTIGPIFSDTHKASFYSYINEGGAMVGVHSAIDTNRDWPFYTKLVGAEFVGHPPLQMALMQTIDRTHPTTSFLPPTWEILEEFYNFAKPLELKDKHIILAVDEDSYEGGIHGAMHPISWTRLHYPVGSRVWITALGHSPSVYSSHEWPARQFQRHLALGVEWAANGTATARRRATEMTQDIIL